MADVTYSAEFVVLLDKLKKGVVDTQTTLTNLEKEFKKKGESSGEGFGKGIKKGFNEAGKEATKFGENIAKSLGPIGLILAAATAAINFFKESLGKAVSENKAAGAAFEAFGNIINSVTQSALKPVVSAITGIVTGLITLGEKLGLVEKGYIASAAAAKEYNAALEANRDAVERANKAYGDTMASLRALGGTETQLAKAGLDLSAERLKAAYKDYEAALNLENATNAQREDARRAYEEAKTQYEWRLHAYEALEKAEEERRKAAEAAAAEGPGEKEIAERKAIVEAVDQEIRANKLKYELSEKSEKDLAALRESNLAAFQSGEQKLIGLAAKYNASAEKSPKLFAKLAEYHGEINKLSEKQLSLKDAENKLEELGNAYARNEAELQFKLNNGIISQKECEDQIVQMQQQFNSELARAAAEYQEVTGAAELFAGAVKGSEQSFDFAKLSQGIATGAGYFQDAASSVLSITGRMAQDQIDIITSLLEEQKELIDAQYEETMARLEEERQAALEAAGFVQAVTEEGLAASMEAAMASGDEGVIYKEKRRQEELAINKQYDDLEAAAEKKKLADTKAAEEKAAREIAEIQYKQAMAEWTNSLITAGANVAEGITKAIAQGGMLGAVTGAIAGALGALQIAAIAAAVPKKPSFAGGGVIGMPETYSSGYANGGIVEANAPRGVDAVEATLANREMVLNDGQQKNLFTAINEGALGGGGDITVRVPLVVDGETLAELVVDLINNGATRQIEARMIAQ